MSTKLACSVVPTTEICPNCRSEMTITEVTPIFLALQPTGPVHHGVGGWHFCRARETVACCKPTHPRRRPSSVRACGGSQGAAPSRRLQSELALRFRQGLRLDEQTLSFVAAPALAEAHDHDTSGAFRLDPAREQRISGGQKLEIVETDAPQARRARILHHEKISGATAPVACPRGVQWANHHQFRCTARLLRQALLLPLRKLARKPMGAVQPFDRRGSALAEAQCLPRRRPRDIGGLTRDQPLRGRP